MQENNNGSVFMKVQEVMEILNCSETFAYRVIKKLNDELQAQGKITMAGRVNRKYFMEKITV